MSDEKENPIIAFVKASAGNFSSLDGVGMRLLQNSELSVLEEALKDFAVMNAIQRSYNESGGDVRKAILSALDRVD